MSYGRIYSIWDNHRRIKVYVGQTRIREDLTPHGLISEPAFARQPLRYIYCIESEWETIEQTQLDRLEIEMIIRRNTWRVSNQRGMNLRLGGSRGRHSHGTIAKLSVAHIGKKLSEETKAKMRKPRPSWHISIRSDPDKWATFQAHSRSNGAKVDNQAESDRKRIESPELFTRIQNQARKNGDCEKARNHLIQLNKGRTGKPLSEETRQKMREARAKWELKRSMNSTIHRRVP